MIESTSKWSTTYKWTCELCHKEFNQITIILKDMYSYPWYVCRRCRESDDFKIEIVFEKLYEEK